MNDDTVEVNYLNEDSQDIIFANSVENNDLEEIPQSPEETLITSSTTVIDQPQSLKDYYQNLFKQMPLYWNYNSITSDQIVKHRLPIANKFQPYTEDEKQLIRYLYEESNIKTSKGNTIHWVTLHKMYVFRCQQFHFFKPEFKLYFRKASHLKETTKKIIKK